MTKQCECSDVGCQHARVGGSECKARKVTTLYRIDMEDRTGVYFCEMCADDAWDSGLFGDSPNFYSR